MRRAFGSFGVSDETPESVLEEAIRLLEGGEEENDDETLGAEYMIFKAPYGTPFPARASALENSSVSPEYARSVLSSKADVWFKAYEYLFAVLTRGSYGFYGYESGLEYAEFMAKSILSLNKQDHLGFIEDMKDFCPLISDGRTRNLRAVHEALSLENPHPEKRRAAYAARLYFLTEYKETVKEETVPGYSAVPFFEEETSAALRAVVLNGPSRDLFRFSLYIPSNAFGDSLRKRLTREKARNPLVFDAERRTYAYFQKGARS